MDSQSYWHDLVKIMACETDSSNDGNKSPLCPNIKTLLWSDLSTDGSRGFFALESALYELAAGNGIAFKLASGWRILLQISIELLLVLEDVYEHLTEQAEDSKKKLDHAHVELKQLPSQQHTVTERFDTYISVLLTAKLTQLSSIMGNSVQLERDMLNGVDKEVAARRHVHRLNQQLLQQGIIPDRLQHEIRVQHIDLMSSIPQSMRQSLQLLLRQADGKLQISLSDCALAEFQTSSLTILLYAGLRVSFSLAFSYLLVILHPTRRLGLVMTLLSVLYSALVVINFDGDVERTRELTWHIEHSLQHVAHRRLATASDQHRQLLMAEILTQFSELRAALDEECRHLENFLERTQDMARTCHLLQTESAFLHSSIHELEDFIL